jgi:hypothetical protein
MTAFALTLILAAPPVADPAVKLTVRPAAEPKPALTYRLLPDVRELVPGNPVQWYVRAFAEQRRFFYDRESIAERQRLRKLPLPELLKQDTSNYARNPLTQADWGARLDTPDWEVLKRVQDEGLGVKFHELDSLRILGEALQVRFRVEVAKQDFPAAARTAQTMFALARHLGEYPATTANLLGIEIAHMALDTIEEMVARSKCPNLYWPLTDLPAPLVDVRKGVQGDRAAVLGEFRGLRDDGAMTEADLDEFVGRLSGKINLAREQAGRPPRGLRPQLAALAKDAERVKDAKLRYVFAGRPEAVSKGFPATQVILLEEKSAFEAACDDAQKVLNLPAWQAEEYAGRTTPAGGLFADLAPRVLDLRRAQAKLEQRIALLRHVEAVRLYAAANRGAVPPHLTDLPVPLPPDPVTGKPFGYAADHGTATVVGRGRRYEVTVQN